MKKFLLLLAVVAFAFTGCYEDIGPENPDVNGIHLDNSSLVFSAEGASDYYLGVMSDYSWNASTSDSWITIHNTYGEAGYSYLRFTVAPNYTSAERMGQVVVFSEAYNLSAVLDVYQDYNPSIVEFNLSVSNITKNSVDVKISAKEADRTFYWDYISESQFNEFGTSKEFMENYLAYLGEFIAANNMTWGDVLSTGADEYTIDKLKPGTSYVLWAVGVDVNGNVTSSDITYASFTTEASTFDQTQWFGGWNVTASKHISIVIDPFDTSENPIHVTKVVEAPLTKTIIIDDATEDMGEPGYVWIFGLDDCWAFEDGSSLPALGYLVDNTIEVVNDFLISQYDDTIVLGWCASFWYSVYQTYMPVVGDFPAYTLVMAEDGSVTMTAASGTIIGDGIAFTNELFRIYGFDDEGYFYTFSSEDDLYYLSGETMVVEKAAAAAPALAPAKLSAKSVKKNFRAVHKMAHPAVAAKTFTAARFVK